MDNPQPNTCVQCDGELATYAVISNIVLPYCPNPACPNYGLVTVGKGGVES